MSGKLLLIAVVAIAVLGVAECQFGGARTADINDPITNQALNVALDKLASVAGLCRNALLLQKATQQVTKGNTYTFVFKVNPSDCGTTTSTLTTCTINVQYDIEASTADKPVLTPGTESCQ